MIIFDENWTRQVLLSFCYRRDDYHHTIHRTVHLSDCLRLVGLDSTSWIVMYQLSADIVNGRGSFERNCGRSHGGCKLYQPRLALWPHRYRLNRNKYESVYNDLKPESHVERSNIVIPFQWKLLQFPLKLTADKFEIHSHFSASQVSFLPILLATASPNIFMTSQQQYTIIFTSNTSGWQRLYGCCSTFPLIFAVNSPSRIWQEFNIMYFLHFPHLRSEMSKCETKRRQLQTQNQPTK